MLLVVVVIAAAADAWTTTRGRSSSSSSSSRLQAKRVFIDGEAGTTGLQVRERLARHDEVEVVSLLGSDRKDPKKRAEVINSVDAVVLCLPDEAAREAVGLVAPGNPVKIVDASTARRCDDDWVYGFPEMCRGQRDRIRESSRIANPGCYATGFIALARPLVDAGLLRRDARLACSAVSGYSGGGKALVEIHESPGAEPWGAYGLGLSHKHLPEMAKHSRLETPPLFLPSVGHYYAGMVVSIMLHVDGGDRLYAALDAHYRDEPFVTVVDPDNVEPFLERGTFLEPTRLNGSNNLELFVFKNDHHKTAVLSARLDNLGKGASAAAVQNLNIALGLEEHLGLDLDI
ncbi:hypothetical protein CTAYLR_009152 [Chrysophaeum taylorii]|uniref:Semialdehyde dehydrogenase NAD-binding domain-containing protein n=1 Tax=Chrysophaeum taylorii TaxID=2483200 RepID=A0AAD7XRG1_9STRA|nr:hypothetical protein CTAYLR_009152 [Chrysophaeum taylorii]